MMRLRSLGECAVEVDDARVGPDSEVLFGALLYLMVARGRPVPRGVLFELFWPGRDEQATRHCARQLLYRLRQIGVPLKSDAGMVSIASTEVELDYETLLGAVEADTWRNPGALVFLPGYSPRISLRFDGWLEEHREHVQARIRKALLRQLAEARSEARWADVDVLARQALSCDPLNEEATLALAEATALSGSKTQSLAIIDRYLRELGPDSRDIRVPAAILRRRIADQVPGPALAGTTETQFVGRDASVALLMDLLRSARAGAGRVCVVEGVAGIGKSRLAAEVSAAVALQGVNVRKVVCQESDRERPLSVFADLVPTLMSLRGAVGCSPESLGFLKRLTEHDGRATRPSESTHAAEFVAAQIRHSLLDLLDAVAAERCLLLVIENANRMDPTSAKLFREICEWARRRHILVILTARELPEGFLGDAALDGTVVRHTLKPLADSDASQVFTRFIERHGTLVLEDHRAWCVRIAEGSPFYLRELASHWLSTRETGSLPASLSALIEARLSTLNCEALRTLQACAALGKNATVSRLHRALQYSRHQIIDSLDALENGGFIVSSPSGISCRHDLLSDAALGRLPAAARQVLHSGIGDVLEADAEESQSTALLWDCARQWHLAGEAERAIALAARCAQHSLDLGIPQKAHEILREAIAFCRSPVDELSILKLLSRALHQLSRWQDLRAVLGRSKLLRSELSFPEDHTAEDALLELECDWRTVWTLGPLLERALKCFANPHATTDQRLDAASVAIAAADNMCAAVEAERIFLLSQELRQETSGFGLPNVQVDLIYHASYGSLDYAVELANINIATEASRADQNRLQRALRNGSVPLRRAGHINAAIGHVERAFEIACRYQAAHAAVSAANIACSINLDRGEYREAFEWHDRAQRWLATVDDNGHSSINLCRESVRLALVERRFHDASRLLDEADLIFGGATRLRIHVEHLALRLLVQCFTDSPDSTLVAALEDVYVRRRAYGGQDLVVAALATSLSRDGQRERAEEVVTDYLRESRREKSVPSAELSQAIATFGLLSG